MPIFSIYSLALNTGNLGAFIDLVFGYLEFIIASAAISESRASLPEGVTLTAVTAF